MNTRTYKLTGLAPLMMHNNTALDPFHPMSKELKALTGKRKKTEDDLLKIAELEWHAGLYYDDQIGPYVGGIHIDRTLNAAARLSKRGKDVDRGLSCVELKVPLEYPGPRDRDELFADRSYVDMRPVKVRGSGIMRCRPIFVEWSCKPSILYMPDIWNPDDIDTLVAEAGRLIGLLDYRPRFGRFSVEVA